MNADCLPRYRARRDRPLEFAESNRLARAPTRQRRVKQILRVPSPSPQSAQEQFGVRFGRVQIIDEFFHRFERRQRGHCFAQHQHALPFLWDDKAIPRVL